MPKKLLYQEGTAFSVPLRNGGFAVGVLARMAPKGKLLFGYFFGPRKDSPEFDLNSLDPARAALVGRFGDLHLHDGRWKSIGQMPNWDRLRWPLPVFLKRDPLGHLPDRVVRYDENDLSKPGQWEHWKVTPEGIPTDGLMGAGFVEIALSNALA